MKVEEVNSILNNPHMQKADCNFKLTKQNPGKPPQWFKDWYSDFSGKLFARLDNVDQRLDKQEKFNEVVVKRLDKIDDRLDKQEKFNEEMIEFKDMVLDQFKKHKWIK